MAGDGVVVSGVMVLWWCGWWRSGGVLVAVSDDLVVVGNAW